MPAKNEQRVTKKSFKTLDEVLSAVADAIAFAGSPEIRIIDNRAGSGKFNVHVTHGRKHGN